MTRVNKIVKDAENYMDRFYDDGGIKCLYPGCKKHFKKVGHKTRTKYCKVHARLVRIEARKILREKTKDSLKTA